MNSDYEQIIQTIDSPVEGERTIVVACIKVNEDSRLEIRQQSYGGQQVGWFTQNTTPIAANQIAALRMALGLGSAMPAMVEQAKVDRLSTEKSITANSSDCHLRIWEAESA